MRVAHVIFATITWFLVSSIVYGQSFFVAPTGNDTNPGTEELPWRTIQKAGNSATEGSTVYVKSGVYNEKAVINVSGSAIAGHIVFRPFASDTVVLDGSGVAGENIIEITNKEYIKIIGFTIRNNFVPPDSINYGGSGILVSGASHDIVLQYNRIHEIRGVGAMGITIYGTTAPDSLHDILVDGNEVFDCEPARSEAIAVSGNVADVVVTYNVVHDVNNIGIAFSGYFGICPDSTRDFPRRGLCKWNSVYNCRTENEGGYAAGIYIDGGSDILAEGNLSTSNDVGISIGCEVPGGITQNARVESNFIFNNDKRGISIGGFNFPVETGLVRDSWVRFNTLYCNDLLATGEGELLIDYALNCVIEGNIFHSDSNNTLVLSNISVFNNNISLDYNLWYTPAGADSAFFRMNGRSGKAYRSFTEYRTSTGLDAHSLFANPRFVDSSFASPNLHLQPGSPAIGAGNPSFVATPNQLDIDEEPRVIGGIVDLGADEFSGPTAVVHTPPTPKHFALSQNYPNPFNPSTTIEFSLPTRVRATLKVFNLLGQEITTLVNDVVAPGNHSVVFNAHTVASGIYFCHLAAGSYTAAIRMIILR